MFECTNMFVLGNIFYLLDNISLTRIGNAVIEKKSKLKLNLDFG